MDDHCGGAGGARGLSGVGASKKGTTRERVRLQPRDTHTHTSSTGFKESKWQQVIKRGSKRGGRAGEERQDMASIVLSDR